MATCHSSQTESDCKEETTSKSGLVASAHSVTSSRTVSLLSSSLLSLSSSVLCINRHAMPVMSANQIMDTDSADEVSHPMVTLSPFIFPLSNKSTSQPSSASHSSLSLSASLSCLLFSHLLLFLLSLEITVHLIISFVLCVQVFEDAEDTSCSSDLPANKETSELCDEFNSSMSIVSTSSGVHSMPSSVSIETVSPIENAKGAYHSTFNRDGVTAPNLEESLHDVMLLLHMALNNRFSEALEVSNKWFVLREAHSVLSTNLLVSQGTHFFVSRFGYRYSRLLEGNPHS